MWTLPGSLNTLSSDRRRYQLKARAEGQRQTRERIVEATEALHREVGPARTTIADIARRAGVQRLTVYNTFPTMSELLLACQKRFLHGNPPPALTLPRPGDDALACLRSSLRALYEWFRATRDMEHHVHRDRTLVPELDALMRATSDAALDAAARGFAQAIDASSPRATRTEALIRLALEFGSWRVLADRGLGDAEIAELLSGAVSASLTPRRAHEPRPARPKKDSTA